MGDVGHNCGIVVTHNLHDAYSFTKSLQHRGRDGAGIAGVYDEGIDVLRWTGEISRFDMGNLPNIFSREYHSFLGHVRYATSGRKSRILEDTHPVVIGGVEERRDSHIFVRGAEMACVMNGQVDDKYFCDDVFSELRSLDTEKFLHFYGQYGEKEVLKKIPGAYTVAIADVKKKDVIILRDRSGIKPGVLGVKDGRHVIASEEIAFMENGANFLEELKLGSVYYLASDGSYEVERVVGENPQSCFFEGNYISHVLSSLNRVMVRSLRQELGEKLAEEYHFEDIDFVTYLPRCPEPAARSYAKKVNKPFVPVFYKPRAERAFQCLTTEERGYSISKNLWLLPGMRGELEGKRIVCVDDSTIRGNNSKRARELLYGEAKVEVAYLLNYTPKIGIVGDDGKERGCMFGVDMPLNDNFVARNRGDDEISEIIGMPVRYLSLEGMLEVFESLGIRRENLCTFCVGGEHPFRD
jgi:amidophosphoribosyltransferase